MMAHVITIGSENEKERLLRMVISSRVTYWMLLNAEKKILHNSLSFWSIEHHWFWLQSQFVLNPTEKISNLLFFCKKMNFM